MGAAVLGALAFPAGAWGASETQALFNGSTLSVRSGDGCALKETRFTSTSVKARQDFRCESTGSPAPAAGAGAFALNDGDTLTVVSGDGCVLKPVRLTERSPKLERNVTCEIKGSRPPAVTPPPVVEAVPPRAVTGGATWKSVWSDEFSGIDVDATKWNVADNSNFGSDNREDQCYQRENATVAAGTLRFEARRETVTGCGRNPHGGAPYYYFTSGLVTTRAQHGPVRMKFRHGYAEVQMRVPRGNIYWPAFWLVSAGDGSSPPWPAYGEIDVAEIYGSRPDVSESNFYRTGGGIGGKRHNVDEPRSHAAGINVNAPNPLRAGGTNDWHRYGIRWSSSRLDWYVDGIPVRTYRATSKADRKALGYEKSIILNLALGGSGPRSHGRGFTGGESGGAYKNGNLSADIPGVMEIDYVRIWQP